MAWAEGKEQPLRGGNVSAGVVRVGDTVRRPAGPHTAAVHALLAHLHAAGFEGAPRPLGIDERGREVLSFIPGTVPWPGHFGLLAPAERLARAARLIRDFHDAAAGFVPPAGARWQVLIPAEGECDIIAHHDLAPWNLVIGPRWAFIDWDCAAPGTRLWDVAYAVHGFVPMSADPRWQRTDAGLRLRIFADAYGLNEAQRRDLVPLLARRTRAMHGFLARQAAAGAEPWSGLWEAGHGGAWQAGGGGRPECYRGHRPGSAASSSPPDRPSSSRSRRSSPTTSGLASSGAATPSCGRSLASDVARHRDGRPVRQEPFARRSRPAPSRFGMASWYR